MSFFSQTYLVFFLAIFIVYWLLRPGPIRKLLLLAGSFVFYSWLHPWMGAVLLAFILANHWLSARLSGGRAKAFYLAGLVFNLGGLLLFKYFDFLQDIVLSLFAALDISITAVPLGVLFPLGLSFYSLQFISYLTDVHHGTLQREESLINFALYSALFPKLIAGPIERGSQLLPQITAPVKWSWERFNQGWMLVIQGYLSKVFIADNLALLVDKVFTLQKPTLWLLAAGALAFTIQIYADFSAYTHLARGFGKLLGFDLTENFNSPYTALSPADFWRRWHISFSNWLRDYIFSPVLRWITGWQASDVIKIFLPALAAMLFSGFWHGVGRTFIVWGLYYGVLIGLYQLLKIDARLREAPKLVRLLAWGVNLGWVVAGWVIFRAPSVTWLWNTLREPIFGRAQDSLITGSVILTLTAFYGLPLLIRRWLNELPVKHAWAEPVYYAVAFIFIVIFVDPIAQEFIYFNF